MDLSCIVIDDEPHARAEMEDLIDQTAGISLEKSFGSAQDAILYLHQAPVVDVIFSDINMPNIDGIEAGNILGNYCHFLIYVTAHREYGEQAFRVNAKGYLVKPLKQIDFLEQVEKLILNKEVIINQEIREEDAIFFKGDRKNTLKKIAPSEIIYFEAMLNYVKIHTTTKMETTYIGLTALSRKLASNRSFYRISKSIIININYIEEIDGHMVLLGNGMYFTISPHFKEPIVTLLHKKTLND